MVTRHCYFIILIVLYYYSVQSYYIKSYNLQSNRLFQVYNSKSDKSTQGKGFGKKQNIPQPENISNNIENVEKLEIKNEIPIIRDTNTIDDPLIINEKIKDEESVILNTKMFRLNRLKQREELNKKIKELKDEEDLIATDPSVGAVPELVANRMITRIAGFFGVPVFGGLLIFVVSFFISKKYDFVVPPTIVAYATQVPFVIGLMGISYAILSSSWDEEPGSFWGFKEFNINVQRVRDGLERTRRNASLKDEIEKEQQRLGK